MKRPDLGISVERMTAYCTYCPKMCRFTCPAASAESRETVTPWGMMRLLELARDGSVALDQDVADAFYHCTGCRRCQTFCAHGNDVPQALWKARAWAAEEGFLPPALEKMRENFDTNHSPYNAPQAPIDLSPFDAEASIGFWPDCATIRYRPHTIGAIGRLIVRATGRKVRLIQLPSGGPTPCCGFPLSAAGIKSPETIREERWPSLHGLDFVWTDCPALAAWNHQESSWPLPPRQDDPSMGHIFELLASRLDELGRPEKPLNLADTVLHESCFITRQINALGPVHKILEYICTTPPSKMAYNGQESPCCGGRVQYRMLEPEASNQAAKTVFDTLQAHPDQDRMVTTSSMCRHALEEAGANELAASLLELICQAYNCS